MSRVRRGGPELAVDVREVGPDGVTPCRARRRSPCSGAPRGEPGDTLLGLGQLLRRPRRRPLIRLSSARAFSAQGAPSSSNDREGLPRSPRGRAFLLRLPVHRAAAEQRAAALEGPGCASSSHERALEGREGGRQSPSPRRAGRGSGASRTSASGLPRRRACDSYASRYARACSSSPRATSVSIVSAQSGLRRIVHPAGEQSSGKFAQVAAGRLQVAERELEPAEHAECEGKCARSSSPARTARPRRPMRAPRRRARGLPRPAP